MYLHELATRAPIFARLAEAPVLLKLARGVLNEDCVLADVGGNSIGPHTDGGAWHVDVTPGQLPEPLPEFALTTQIVWMVDGSPPRTGPTGGAGQPQEPQEGPMGRQPLDGEVGRYRSRRFDGDLVVEHLAKARSEQDRPRPAGRALLLLPLLDKGVVGPPADGHRGKAKELSPTLRYLLGFSSNPIVRG